jgi:hypothetical protein
MRYVTALISIATIAFSQNASAQNYIPLPSLAESPLAPITSSMAETASETPANINVPVDSPLRCANPPLQSALGLGQFKQITLDRNAAADLGLPVGNFSTSLVKKVLIQEWTRTANCVATDGVTELAYGQGIRLIAASEGIDVEGDLSLGMLAANSTLNNKTSSVQVNIIGFNDQQLTSLGTQIFGKIDVDRFSTVDDLVKKMVNRASALNGGSVQRLAVVFPPSSASDHAIAAFALQQVKDGKSCNQTKARFPNLTTTQMSLISIIYNKMETSCDNSDPNAVARARAGSALGKIRVSL